jgi:hypothetical protein
MLKMLKFQEELTLSRVAHLYLLVVVWVVLQVLWPANPSAPWWSSCGQWTIFVLRLLLLVSSSWLVFCLCWRWKCLEAFIWSCGQNASSPASCCNTSDASVWLVASSCLMMQYSKMMWSWVLTLYILVAMYQGMKCLHPLTQTLGSWVHIPLWVWICVCLYLCVVVLASRQTDHPSSEIYGLCTRLVSSELIITASGLSAKSFRVAWVREPTEWPPLDCEVSANFFPIEGTTW